MRLCSFWLNRQVSSILSKMNSTSSALEASMLSTRRFRRLLAMSSTAFRECILTCCLSLASSAFTSSATHQALRKSTKPASTATTCEKCGFFLESRAIMSSNLFISHPMLWPFDGPSVDSGAVVFSIFGRPHVQPGCTCPVTESRSPSRFSQMPACWFTAKAQIQYTRSEVPRSRISASSTDTSSSSRAATSPKLLSPAASAMTAATRSRNRFRQECVTIRSG
mmetsp:Transcript_7507/g.17980  ORF Transcript_7507/g.17980 Transcript_7507/m.17980 type:complete len:223 (-) Transcript_7507:1376-2044(-)